MVVAPPDGWFGFVHEIEMVHPLVLSVEDWSAAMTGDAEVSVTKTAMARTVAVVLH